MSFFKKGMATVFGIGGTKVDTIVHSTEIRPGEEVFGVCRIKGGSVEQEIRKITLNVRTSYKKESGDSTTTVYTTLQRIPIHVSGTVEPGTIEEVPFSFILDYKTPVSMNKSKVWISTDLDIAKAVDSGDKDYIKVLPSYPIEAVLEAVAGLGFRLREVENEYDSKRISPLDFVQEFEFVPYEGDFRGRLDELEVIIIPNQYGLELRIEVDRKARGLKGIMFESLGLDEKNVKIEVDYNSLSVRNIQRAIYEVINNSLY